MTTPSDQRLQSPEKPPLQAITVAMAKALGPAVPTILIACYLARDFDDLLNGLYLTYLVIYPMTVILEVIVLSIFAVYYRSIRHPAALAILILLTGTFLLPMLESPVETFIREHTRFNRVSAIVRESYQAEDTFRFTTVASGTGSKESFTLDGGYTNILVNENMYSGPSLRFKLKPTLAIWIDRIHHPMDEDTLIEAFNINDMSQLTATQHPMAYKSVLETLAKVNSQEDYYRRFGRNGRYEIGFVPDGNTVYRCVFGIIIMIAMMMSAVLQIGKIRVSQPEA